MFKFIKSLFTVAPTSVAVDESWGDPVTRDVHIKQIVEAVFNSLDEFQVPHNSLQDAFVGMLVGNAYDAGHEPEPGVTDLMAVLDGPVSGLVDIAFSVPFLPETDTARGLATDYLLCAYCAGREMRRNGL